MVDSVASIAYCARMSTTLTIRNLDEEVKQKLRIRAAKNATSMEAEARAIIAQAVAEPESPGPPRNATEMKERLKEVRGLWKDRGTTDDLMKLTRGEE